MQLRVYAHEYTRTANMTVSNWERAQRTQFQQTLAIADHHYHSHCHLFSHHCQLKFKSAVPEKQLVEGKEGEEEVMEVTGQEVEVEHLREAVMKPKKEEEKMVEELEKEEEVVEQTGEEEQEE